MSDEKPDERPGEPRPLLPLSVLSVAGQACVDWAYDTGTCHLCGRGILRMEKGRIAVETTMHDRGCPLALMDAEPLEGEALRKQIVRDQLYSILTAIADAEVPLKEGEAPSNAERDAMRFFILGSTLGKEIKRLEQENAELRAQLDKGDAGFIERAMASHEAFKKAFPNPLDRIRAIDEAKRDKDSDPKK